MAAVEVTISGVLFDKIRRTTVPVVLIGEASLTGLSVGGGPIEPPPGGGGEPGIPTFPIAGYPENPYPSQPIYRPGYPGGSPPPSFPDVKPPDNPPDENGFVKPPPEEGGWAYHEEYGWMYAPGGQNAGPKK